MHKQQLFYPLALQEAQPLSMFTWQDKLSFWQKISLTSGFYFIFNVSAVPGDEMSCCSSYINTNDNMTPDGLLVENFIALERTNS